MTNASSLICMILLVGEFFKAPSSLIKEGVITYRDSGIEEIIAERNLRYLTEGTSLA